MLKNPQRAEHPDQEPDLNFKKAQSEATRDKRIYCRQSDLDRALEMETRTEKNFLAFSHPLWNIRRRNKSEYRESKSAPRFCRSDRA
jgi:hypothetical protein